MLEALDAAAVRSWSRHAVASLEAHRLEIDRLNVFPVHDSDTGTNLVTTMRAAHDALAGDRTDNAAEALRVLARGAVVGASGNSGNIVAQLLRAIADVAAEAPVCDAAALREGLRRGAVQARAAVADPVEGTILTVATASAAAVADNDGSLAEVAELALLAATDALRRTTGQLAVLASAGVVDAGAQGLVLLLAALLRSVGGQPVDQATDIATDTAIDVAQGVAPGIAPGVAPDIASTSVAATTESDGVHRGSDRYHRGSDGYHRGSAPAFEVQYLLDTIADFSEESAEQLRAELLLLGDSVVVVGTGDGTWSVHVHTDQAGAAVEAGITVGRPYRISVSRIDEPTAPPKPGAVIAIAPGAGLGRMFETEGVRVVAGGSPGVADVVSAMLATNASEIVLLPNNSEIAGVAEAAADLVRERGIRVAVVPTRSPVQGLAAVAVHDPGRRFDDDVVAMAEAAAATRFVEVTIAEHESLTSVGICQAGDVLGLIDGEVVEIGRGVLAVAFVVTDRLLGVGAELMTVLVGAETQHGLGDVVRRHVLERSPLTEVTVYDVGQLRHRLIIGVE